MLSSFYYVFRRASKALLALSAFAGSGAAVCAQEKEPPDLYAHPIPGPGSTLSQKPLTALPNTPPVPYGLQLMAQWDSLPMLRDTRCLQDSSYEPGGGNGDAGHFFKKEGNKAILSDIQGPGCIYRFWSANAAGHLKIFFDGEASPRIDCPMQDLFLGKVAPFVAPLVGHRSGGWYCFFPMPFQKGCRIEVTDPGAMYYQVEFQRFAEGTPVRTFAAELAPEDQSALQIVLAQWNNLGRDPRAASPASPPVSRPDTPVLKGEFRLRAGATRAFATLKGAGEVTSLHLTLAPADRATLRRTLLRVYWDGAKKPAIEAPVGDFFGVGFGDPHIRSLPTVMQDDGFTCYWPMPFGRSARFELVNTGKTELRSITYRVEAQRWRKPLPNAGYFHAQWHRQTTVTGEPFHILQVKGRGHYVGAHTEMQGDRGLGFLEGDEKVYVDGETFPSIHGTGTEDFYTGGWYFDEGPFNLAYHGCTVKEDAISRVSAYRFQITDCVPFQQDFKIEIEHGGVNDYPGADYCCVAYWYQDKPTHEWSPIDAAQLTPARWTAANAQEAESLVWNGGRMTPVSDETLPVEASGGSVAAVSGDRPTATFTVEREDNYSLHLSLLNLPDSVKTAGMSVDGGASQAVAFGSESRADVTTFLRLKPGSHTLALDMAPNGRAYMDYLRLEPSRKEANVVEGESLLETLTGHGKTDAGLVDARPQYSGGSALRWHPVPSAEILALPLSVAVEADYAVEMALDAGESTPVWTLRGEQGPPQTARLPAKSQGVQKLRFGTMLHLTPGKHIFVLTGGGDKPSLTLDWLRLIKTRYPNSIEAESLKTLESNDGRTETQDMRGFGPDWSADAQFWFLADKAGAQATLELPVGADGKYNLIVYYTTARDYAVVQALVDGIAVGSPTDAYTPDVRAKGRLSLGTLNLTAGAHRLTFRVTGKNALSSGYLVGVDAIGLEPVK